MFQIVLRHIQRAYPHWRITIETPYGGVFDGMDVEIQPLASAYYHTRWNYENAFSIKFGRSRFCEPFESHTKAAKCVLDEFALPLEPALFYYSIKRTTESERIADAYASSLGEFAVCHFTGNSRQQKNMTLYEQDMVLAGVKRMGMVPVVLNDAFWASFPKDPQALTSLIDRAALFVGVDSGPAHLAGATETPSIVIWKGLFPSNSFDPCSNVMHWIDDSCLADVVPDFEVAWDWFKEHYDWYWYDDLATLWDTYSRD